MDLNQVLNERLKKDKKKLYKQCPNQKMKCLNFNIFLTTSLIKVVCHNVSSIPSKYKDPS